MQEERAAIAGNRTSVLTEPLGGGPLTAAAVGGDAPAGWYPVHPRGVGAWREQIAATRARFGGAGWLQELMPAIQPTGPARERLLRAAEHGVVVTSGQQPGLFGGPMYTWTKAIGILALADALERACGVPVAPLFWAATDDADFAESSTTWVSVPGGVEALCSLPEAPAGTLLAAAPMGDLSVQLGRLIDAAGSAPYAAALDAVRAAYGAGQSGHASMARRCSRIKTGSRRARRSWSCCGGRWLPWVSVFSIPRTSPCAVVRFPCWCGRSSAPRPWQRPCGCARRRSRLRASAHKSAPCLAFRSSSNGVAESARSMIMVPRQ